jgi:dihydroorotate dehydrogenase
VKPWLLLPPQLAHDLAPLGLQVLAAFREPRVEAFNPFNWQGLHFASRLGLAGGVDKNAEQVEDWWTFGPGFIEVGTVTPKPQGANPGPILKRDSTHLALWNRMGFPSHGAEAVKSNLLELPRNRLTPIFVNIGKNRTTATSDAARDYISCIEVIAELADAYVINISSPNTAGLRDLFREENFRPFLLSILDKRSQLKKHVPVLLKLSPDLTSDELRLIVQTAHDVGTDGFIATNSTLERKAGLEFPIEGGVSGKPLADRAKSVLQQVITALGPRRKNSLVISAGGVMTPEDVLQRIELGADLVEVYTTLVFDGPWLFGRVARLHLEKHRV